MDAWLSLIPAHTHAEHPEMMKREQPEIDLTADEDDGEPVAQRAKVEVPAHLLCPITHVMFRDPVMLVESCHTYEREAIERHLQNDRTDPLTRDRIDTAPVTNMNTRNAVQAWLDENPGVTPDGWTSREMPPPQPRGSTTSTRRPAPAPTRRPYAPMVYHMPDLEVLRAWRESCPELRDLWRGDDASHWEGVTWSDGRVTGLHLRDKRLSGQLPRLEGLTSLQVVNISGNMLTGPIPATLFEGLTSLHTVYLSGNMLTGPIPATLFEGLTSLRDVRIRVNYLSGPIPEKLFEGLTALQKVDLSGNHLSGRIPVKLFEGLTSLQTVGLDNNRLSGPIPEKLFEELTSLEKVWLNNTHLSGPIPEKLFEGLTSLQTVNLYSNQLSGPIPERLFEGLTSLKQVNLAFNSLSGSICEHLFEGLHSLHEVKLSGNKRLDKRIDTLSDRLQAIVEL